MRRSPLRSRPKPLSREERALREEWSARPEPCSECDRTGYFGGFNRDAHHVIPRQTLKAAGLDLAAQWDQRNRMWLCRTHHDWHHARYSVIPLDALPESVWEFAADHGLTDRLERIYA